MVRGYYTSGLIPEDGRKTRIHGVEVFTKRGVVWSMVLVCALKIKTLA